MAGIEKTRKGFFERARFIIVHPSRPSEARAPGPISAGMRVQAAVSPRGLRRPWVPARYTGRRGRIIVCGCTFQSNNYWSSTTNADNTDNAWNVNLNNGNVNNDNKTNTNYVWPVRAG